MIKLSEQATRAAFEAFRSRRGEWDQGLRLQIEMYQAAERAFGEGGRLKDFQLVYDGLRKWRLFRGGQVEAAETVFGWLNNCKRHLRKRRLLMLEPRDWGAIRDAVHRMRNVKANRTGPSVMAISKFLHFWNPRLFVICDQEEVERFVFGHQWLRSQLNSVDTGNLVNEGAVDLHPRLAEYLRVLAFASEFVKANPYILARFAETVREIARGTTVPAYIDSYEATAVEWCLIGLAETMPSGVEII